MSYARYQMVTLVVDHSSLQPMILSDPKPTTFYTPLISS